MRLDVWLLLNGIKKKEFAEAIGIQRAALHHILNGSRMPSQKLAKKIYRLTGAKVKVKTRKPIDNWDQ